MTLQTSATLMTLRDFMNAEQSFLKPPTHLWGQGPLQFCWGISPFPSYAARVSDPSSATGKAMPAHTSRVNTDNFRTCKYQSSNGNTTLNYWHKMDTIIPRISIASHSWIISSRLVWYFFNKKDSCLPIFIEFVIGKSLTDATGALRREVLDYVEFYNLSYFKYYVFWILFE